MVCVIPLVGQQPSERACGLDQGFSDADVVDVSGAEQENARLAAIIDQAVDFGRPAATRAAYRLGEGPPFAPAAERWALTWVASIAAPSKMPLCPVRASNICSHRPCRLQRLKRL